MAQDDGIVLAVPPVVARALVPGLAVPETFHAIVNAHFRVAPPPGQPLILGIVNGVTEWLFAYPDRLSVTISCADRLMEEPREKLAETIWREVAALTGLAPELPRWQIVRERRATFSATPREAARRPEARTRFSQPGARRRLDAHRPAGHHRRIDPLRPDRGSASRPARRTALSGHAKSCMTTGRDGES